MKLPTFPLNLNYFEYGYLYGCINKDAWDQMPRSLWLKLHIQFTKAYVNHEKFGKQAKADIEKWNKELRGL